MLEMRKGETQNNRNSSTDRLKKIANTSLLCPSGVVVIVGLGGFAVWNKGLFMDCAFVYSKLRLCVDELKCFKRGGRVEQSKFKL